MKDQVSNAVACFVRAPPDLFVIQRFNANPQSRPMLLEHPLARVFEKECVYHHSILIAVVGSIRIARSAGKRLPVSVITNATIPPMMTVAGSNGEIPASSACIDRPVI